MSHITIDMPSHATLPKRPVTPQNVHRILSEHMLADGFEMVMDIEKSKGTRLYDSRHNRFVLDFFTFFGSAPIGANHPKLRSDARFMEKLINAAISNPANSDVYTTEMAEFVEVFARLAMPPEMKYVFWVAGGTLGNENAVKAAMDWKVQKNFAKGYKEEKGQQVLHFKQAFHGRSGYTLSLTNTDPVKTDHFTKFDWPRVSNPKMHFPMTEEKLIKLEKAEAHAIAEIKEAFRTRKDDICAIIIEPIQAEGGDNHFRKEFLQALRDITLAEDAMLIFDEVQTGVGLTGTMWVSQQLVMPDMIVFGKKMQVCGLMCSPRIDEIPDNVFRKPSRINSTWGGNLVDMVRVGKFLEIIEEEKLVANAANVGRYLLTKIEILHEDFKKLVTNPRGRGLMCAFDLPTKQLRNDFLAKAEENGLIILGCGESSVRFRPPLNLSVMEVDEGMDIIRKSLKAVKP